MRSAMLLWSGAGLMALALTACDDARNRASQEPPVTTPGANTAAGANVDTIKEAPERFYGKKVSLVGEVDEIYNNRAFELDGTGWAFNDNITVLTKTPVGFGGAALTGDDEVVVTGTVRPFVAAEVERDLGWDIGEGVEIKLTRRPVIVADSIRKIGESGLWPAGGTEPVTSTLVLVTTTEPWVLAGRKVDLRRERVQAVTGKGLWVGPSAMGQVFVLPNQPPKDVKRGDWVSVSGTMQKMPKDAVKTWDLPTNMEGMVTEDMVFVAGATVSKVAEGATGQGTR